MIIRNYSRCQKLYINHGLFTNISDADQFPVNSNSHSITQLKFRFCEEINPESLTGISPHYPYLKTLEFKDCDFIIPNSPHTALIDMPNTVVDTLILRKSVRSSSFALPSRIVEKSISLFQSILKI